jgi:hypothetical protein
MTEVPFLTNKPNKLLLIYYYDFIFIALTTLCIDFIYLTIKLCDNL